MNQSEHKEIFAEKVSIVISRLLIVLAKVNWQILMSGDSVVMAQLFERETIWFVLNSSCIELRDQTEFILTVCTNQSQPDAERKLSEILQCLRELN